MANVILICSDSRVEGHVRDAVSADGHELHVAPSVREAETLARETPPEAVLVHEAGTPEEAGRAAAAAQTCGAPVVVLAEAGLSYLGVGIMPPTPSWGAMVNDGFEHLLTNPLLTFWPGIAIMIVVFAFNMIGDGLRDAFDPRLRGTI